MSIKWVVFNTYWSRLKGLMGKTLLPDDHFFVLVPCSSIHTFGMKTAIDVCSYDKSGQILQTFAAVEPNKILSFKGAHGVIEGKAGLLIKYNLQVGDNLPIEQFKL